MKAGKVSMADRLAHMKKQGKFGKKGGAKKDKRGANPFKK